jgi:hypothetical protein
MRIRFCATALIAVTLVAVAACSSDSSSSKELSSVFLRPVLSCQADTTPAKSLAVADLEQQAVVPMQGGGSCKVGPAVSSAGLFQHDAKAENAPDAGWDVKVSYYPSANLFNSVAAACFSKAASCPNGIFATQVDGQIVTTAPAVSAEFVGSTMIVVRLTETEAKHIADLINTGPGPTHGTPAVDTPTS